MIYEVHLILNQFHERAAQLRAEVARDKHARQAESTSDHRPRHRERPARRDPRDEGREKHRETRPRGVACSSP